jgi:penicillin-binding protein 2
VNVTPMQQLVLYAALATGVVWKPQVVVRVEDVDGRVVSEFAPQERSRLGIKKTTRDVVMKGLLAAVNEPYGTAWWSRLKDVAMAGKTGTAQVLKLGAKRLKAEQMAYLERDHAWFAAFAPADDPEVVVVVLNEHSGFGASKAAPTAAAVVKRWLELKAQDEVERAGPAPDAPAPPAPPPPPPSGPPGKERPKRGRVGGEEGGRGA